MKSTTLGIDLLASTLRTRKKKGRKLRVGVLCHPSSATRQFSHLSKIADEFAEIISLFGPQHGIFGETQDNMIEWQDQKDDRGRPVYSLYGERRKPTPLSVANLDLMIVDLFDVGSRYYTFIYTMAYTLETCGDAGVPVLVCDRPNPLNGNSVEGNILDMNFRSFVGMYPLATRHGMTIGELAQFFIESPAFSGKRPQLEILKMKNWKRGYYWPQTNLVWTLPSPNMPNFSAALLYPGGCLWEGTSISEGRGTTRPFELIGAPFFNWEDIEKEYSSQAKKLKMSPVIFHRQGFIPTFHKYQGELCKGALQFVPKVESFQPLRHTVLLMWVLRKLYGESWIWKAPPYEYEYVKLPIDILAGGVETREAIDRGESLRSLFDSWRKDEELFKKQRKPFLLY